MKIIARDLRSIIKGNPFGILERRKNRSSRRRTKSRGPILDIGCGTGTVALYFAARGESVTAIDFVDEAIRQAKEKAKRQNAVAEFFVKDFFTVGEWNRKFANVIDSGLFHIFTDNTERRERYFQVLEQVLEPGGRLYQLTTIQLMPFTQQEFEGLFPKKGWTLESIREFVAEVTPEAAAEHPGFNWNSWFTVLQWNG